MRFAFAALLLLVVASSAKAEEPSRPREPAPPAPAEPRQEATSESAPRAASAEEAKALLEGLKSVAKKQAPEVLKALDAWKGLQHAEFVKPLSKLLAHEEADVALRAALLLRIQKPVLADAKAAAKEADRAMKEIWKLGFAHPVNDKRPVVQGAIVRLHGAWELRLDDQEFDDVVGLWRQQMGNPDPLRVAALVDVVATAEETKDKRFCRLLAEQIDEPVAGSVNDASNPPASYWEARWKSWREIRDHVVRALKTITGQEFATTAAAKAWFRANERSFGFRW
jgi:hypothetical protein